MAATEKLQQVLSTPGQKDGLFLYPEKKTRVSLEAPTPLTGIKLTIAHVSFNVLPDKKLLSARCIVSVGQRSKAVDTANIQIGKDDVTFLFDATSNYDYFKISSEIKKITVKVEVSGRSSITKKPIYIDAIGTITLHEGIQGSVRIPLITGHNGIGEARIVIETQLEGYFDDSASEDGDYSATPSPMTPVRLNNVSYSGAPYRSMGGSTTGGSRADSGTTASGTVAGISPIRRDYGTPVQLQWNDSRTSSAVKYTVQSDTNAGRSAPSTPIRSSGAIAGSVAVAERTTALDDNDDKRGSSTTREQQEKSLARSLTATTVSSVSTSQSRSGRSSSTSSSSGSASSSRANSVETGPGNHVLDSLLLTGATAITAPATEWKQKEEVYKNELSQLRDAILQLEMDRQEAIQRLQSELDDTREELLETVTLLNESLNESIHEYSSLIEEQASGVEDASVRQEGAGRLTPRDGATAAAAVAAAREEQQERQRQLEREVAQLRERMNEEQRQWEEKEQQYVSQIATLQSAQDRATPVTEITSGAPAGSEISPVAPSNAVTVDVKPSSNGNASFFVKSSIALMSALYMIVHSRM